MPSKWKAQAKKAETAKWRRMDTIYDQGGHMAWDQFGDPVIKSDDPDKMCCLLADVDRAGYGSSFGLYLETYIWEKATDLALLDASFQKVKRGFFKKNGLETLLPLLENPGTSARLACYPDIEVTFEPAVKGKHGSLAGLPGLIFTWNPVAPRTKEEVIEQLKSLIREKKEPIVAFWKLSIAFEGYIVREDGGCLGLGMFNSNTCRDKPVTLADLEMRDIVSILRHAQPLSTNEQELGPIQIGIWSWAVNGSDFEVSPGLLPGSVNEEFFGMEVCFTREIAWRTHAGTVATIAAGTTAIASDRGCSCLIADPGGRADCLLEVPASHYTVTARQKQPSLASLIGDGATMPSDPEMLRLLGLS